MSHKTLSQILITLHIGYILASFIQLAFAPLMKPASNDVSKANPSSDEVLNCDISAKSDDFVMTSELYEKLRSDQIVFEERLKSIIEKASPIIFRALQMS